MAAVTSAATGAINATEGEWSELSYSDRHDHSLWRGRYFKARLYGRARVIAVAAGFVVVLVGLMTLGGFGFG